MKKQNSHIDSEKLEKLLAFEISPVTEQLRVLAAALSREEALFTDSEKRFRIEDGVFLHSASQMMTDAASRLFEFHNKALKLLPSWNSKG